MLDQLRGGHGVRSHAGRLFAGKGWLMWSAGGECSGKNRFEWAHEVASTAFWPNRPHRIRRKPEHLSARLSKSGEAGDSWARTVGSEGRGSGRAFIGGGLKSGQGWGRGCRQQADTNARIGVRPGRLSSAERSAPGAKRRSTGDGSWSMDDGSWSMAGGRWLPCHPKRDFFEDLISPVHLSPFSFPLIPFA
jgi:hypothetical protein